VGVWLFGFASLLWSLDCFVGAYLTFPAKGPIAAARAPWLQRWAPCWLIKGNQLFSVAFTWHRASGLWVWGALLVFAWSAVAMNLPQVYDRVMSKLLPPAATTELPLLDSPRTEPRLDLRKALSRGRQLSRELARERGFALLGERQLEYDAERGSYLYRVESTLDIDARLANTTIAFDSDDGHLLSFSSPTTQGARSTIDNWLLALHFGAVREGGVPYRIFVALMGVLVTVLSVTGVWIWWRKRSKRLRAKSGAVAGRARTEKGDLAEQALV
jgi:uncharacterized iron-regulated membrane protein